MKHLEQIGCRLAASVLFGLACLSASGLAGAHGAPETKDVPDGIVKARIAHQPDIPGLSAIILDAPRPGILLQYKGEEPLTVMGSDGKAFIRFTRTEVTVNTDSPSWKALPNRSKETDQTPWVTMSQSGTFGWLDARLNVLHGNHGTGAPQTWSIEVTTSKSGNDRIEGHLTYTPIQ